MELFNCYLNIILEKTINLNLKLTVAYGNNEFEVLNSLKVSIKKGFKM